MENDMTICFADALADDHQAADEAGLAVCPYCHAFGPHDLEVIGDALQGKQKATTYFCIPCGNDFISKKVLT